MPDPKSRVFLVRVELSAESDAVLARQVEYAKQNIGQACKAFGDTDTSIGFYDSAGHRTEAVTRNDAEQPPEQLEIAA